eukprot:Hpha_TRINITY_DN9195_c0_g1::TRINITY_DN9195_c0_g1_i1::g.94480::m.94480
MPDPFSRAEMFAQQRRAQAAAERRGRGRRGGGGGGGGGPRGICYQCGKHGHPMRECPQLLQHTETAELVLRQSRSQPTTWGVGLDRTLKLKKASQGCPAASSSEYQMLIGWTLTGINGQPVKDSHEAMEKLGGIASPGATITLNCRSPVPIPGQDKKKGGERSGGGNNSRAEGLADRLLENIQSGLKRGRENPEVAEVARNAGINSQQLTRLLHAIRTELQASKKELEQEEQENGDYQRRLAEYSQVISENSGGKEAPAEVLGELDADLAKKVEKIKVKIERYKDAEKLHLAAELEKRKRAVLKGIEHCEDDEVVVLAENQSGLSTDDAWQILGLSKGTSDHRDHARKLMAKLHPDRVAVEVCKDTMRMRFQLVQHCRDLLDR